MSHPFACRFCGHDVEEHNLNVGCPHCRCLGTPGEASPRTERQFDAPALAPGQYANERYRPVPDPEPTPIPDAMIHRAAEAIFKLRHPTFTYNPNGAIDEWARQYARAALEATR